jgi:hypothetical protein
MVRTRMDNIKRVLLMPHCLSFKWIGNLRRTDVDYNDN